MWVERDDDGFGARSTSRGNRRSQHPDVSAVDSVEHADRHGEPQADGQLIDIVEYLHDFVSRVR